MTTAEDPPLTEAERRILLRIARRAVRRAVAPGAPETEAPLPEMPERLVRPAGAFVTLKRDGRLRGCIGQLQAARPLHETVEQVARGAATRDPRFAPVHPDELAGLTLSISVLGPFIPLKEISDIRIGLHGLYVRRPGFSGLLLPQVAEEHYWDAETFLRHTCDKAGLWSEAWQEPGTEVFLFTAEEFEEEGGRMKEEG